MGEKLQLEWCWIKCPIAREHLKTFGSRPIWVYHAPLISPVVCYSPRSIRGEQYILCAHVYGRTATFPLWNPEFGKSVGLRFLQSLQLRRLMQGEILQLVHVTTLPQDHVFASNSHESQCRLRDFFEHPQNKLMQVRIPELESPSDFGVRNHATRTMNRSLVMKIDEKLEFIVFW